MRSLAKQYKQKHKELGSVDLSVGNSVALEKGGNRGASFNIWLFQMRMKQQPVGYCFITCLLSQNNRHK
ncbi:hypothetical protein A9Q75_06595 [Colwellia psychrerythraea]|uniref:Uncharacterized protein n=1 Tax=Colwellia psychrerythraea TaxID=28229 RepID=A0A1Y5ENB3_COLPS|nr:hypothetical protein A9Q75_06595 [Colwellia psychrerythraea]